MSYCDGKAKAILYNKGNQIVSEFPPITLTETHIATGNEIIVEGDAEFNGVRSGVKANLQDSEGLASDTYRLVFITYGSNGIRDYYHAEIIRSRDNLSLGYAGADTGWYTASIIKIEPIGGSRCHLEVRDREGRLFYQSDDCKYHVACGDECPDGYLKCECDTYPGYSCVPCGEYLSRLSAIENKISNLIP
jgi:hypothetical protein